MPPNISRHRMPVIASSLRHRRAAYRAKLLHRAGGNFARGRLGHPLAGEGAGGRCGGGDNCHF